jgi:hypothetical protein
LIGAPEGISVTNLVHGIMRTKIHYHHNKMAPFHPVHIDTPCIDEISYIGNLGGAAILTESHG